MPVRFLGARLAGGAEPNIYFSDVFGIDPEITEEYGAFNIARVNDLALFVDPFLLYDSENPISERDKRHWRNGQLK